VVGTWKLLPGVWIRCNSTLETHARFPNPSGGWMGHISQLCHWQQVGLRNPSSFWLKSEKDSEAETLSLNGTVQQFLTYLFASD